MIRWGEMMRRRGGGDVGRFFTDELYMQWLQLPLALEDFPYRGMDYTGDPDAPRPPDRHGAQMVCIIWIVLSSFMLCMMYV